MYIILLTIHSLVRWLVLISLLFAIYRAYKGWFTGKPFLKSDETVRLITATIAHIQFGVGIYLYFVSPIVGYFLHQYKDAVKVGEIRFFGMEHSLMMLIAITIISIGSVKVKNKSKDNEKFRTMAIWFTIGLLVILVSIPWPFSPLVSRPYFRTF
jgi:cytochrome b561